MKDRVREALYPLLYGRPYKFASTKAKTGTAGDGGGMSSPTSPDGFPEGVGESRETKPYIPVTSPEDLEKVLGTPMGG